MSKYTRILCAAGMALLLLAVVRGAAGRATTTAPAAGRGGEIRNRLFGALDADHDGQISREEFDQNAPRVAERLRSGPMAERLRERLRGFIRQEVRQAVREEIGGLGRAAPFVPGCGPGPRLGGPPPGPGPRAGYGFLARPHQGPGPGEAPHDKPPFPGMGVFRLLDANGDGKLQTPEIQRAVDFGKDLLDASQQGDVTPQTWVELLKKHAPPPPPGAAPQGQPEQPR